MIKATLVFVKHFQVRLLKFHNETEDMVFSVLRCFLFVSDRFWGHDVQKATVNTWDEFLRASLFKTCITQA